MYISLEMKALKTNQSLSRQSESIKYLFKHLAYVVKLISKQ